MVAETKDQVTIEFLEYDIEQKDEELSIMKRAMGWWRATAKGYKARATRAESELAAMRQRAKRAEQVSITICNIVDRLRLKFEIQRNVNFTGDYVVQQFIYAKEDLAKAIYEGNPPPSDASGMGGEKVQAHPYGYCPICGAPGVMRERCPNGDDRCSNGHTYPSALAVSIDPNCTHHYRALSPQRGGQEGEEE